MKNYFVWFETKIDAIIKGFHKVGFWLLIALLCGMICGSYLTYQILTYEMTKAVKLQCMIVNSQVYDIKLRP